MMASIDQKEERDPAQVFMDRLMLKLKPLQEATERGDSEVQQFFDGATIFITGGTGFLGKQLIEKLFRATNVSKVFVLIRFKKGKAIKDRLEDILKDPVYETVSEQKPGFEKKIIPVQGDVADLKLGMSSEDWKMVTEQTDIIIHAAATTRFDEVLRVATLINVRGTRETLELGKQCKKLKSFVHVSTAYAHAKDYLINTDVLEDFYPSPVDPRVMIELAESMDEGRLNDITTNLIKGWPNTYSFCKAIAEDLVRQIGDTLPICVVRPAIVICSLREPNPGWLDVSCIYGASGLIVATGIGLMHILYANHETRVGLIPVDYVNNSIIAAAWKTSRKHDKEKREEEKKINIYTVTSSTRNAAKWGYLYEILSNEKVRFFSPELVWYCYALHTISPIPFFILSWITHLIPAYIVDGICLLLGKKRQFVKVYTKMYKMSKALSYFTVNHWHFEDKNLEALYESLSPVDKEIFDFDVKKIDWREYIVLWTVGLRKYIVKDGLKGTAYGRKKQFVFRILHYIIVPIYFYMLYKIVYLAFLTLNFILSIFW